MVSARIFEVFTSIEGEGILYGTKTLFVRMAGCPFSCFYCDTVEALPADSGTEYSIAAACNMIDESLQEHTYKVNFTGGDPLMQHEAVALLAEHVQSMNIPTYLESSCFDSDRFAHVLPHMDYIKVEFKTPDSEFVGPAARDNMHQNALECLNKAVRANKTTYIKVVVSGRTSPEYMRNLAGDVLERAPAGRLAGFVIQPTYGMEEPPLDLLMRMYDAVYPMYGMVRILPQTHKYIGAP